MPSDERPPAPPEERATPPEEQAAPPPANGDEAGGHPLGRFLPRLSVGRPVAVLTLFAAVITVGIIAWRQIPVQMLPEGFEPPYLWIWGSYPNATPREVEEQILRPVEEHFGTLGNLNHINSRASANSCFFELEFEEGTDMAEAYNQALDRIERAYPELPDDFEQFFIWRYDPTDEPIVWAGVSVPEGAGDVAHLMETEVQKKLERIPGVGNVDLWGADRRNIYIDFDHGAVDAMGVNLYQVVPALATDNFTLPGGKVRESGRVIYLRSLARYTSIEEIARWPVRPGLHLDDVAEVVHAAPLATYVNHINGSDGISLGVYKESSANTLEVSAAIVDLLENELPSDPDLQGYEFFILFSQGELISDSIGNLERAALIGGTLAFLVLIIFLRRLRMTMVVAGAIPVCIVITVTVLFFQGETINLLSMTGLMLSVGMVVDNSIVVVENIYRLRQLGVPPVQAALRGAGEVSLAVTMATATTIVVFLPIMFLTGGGMFSFLISRLGLPVCYALIASLVVALVFIPLATTRLSATKPVVPGKILVWFREKYVAALQWVLDHRVDAAAIALGLLATTCVAKSHVPSTDRAQSNINDLVVRVELPDNMSFEEKEQILVDLEDEFLALHDEWRIKAVRTRYESGRSRGDVRVFFQPRKRSDLQMEELTELVEEMLPEIPGGDAWVGWQAQQGMGEGNSVDLELFGENTEVLSEIGNEVKRRLVDLPGVTSVEWEVEEDASNEIQVRVNREAAARYGVNPESLARTVQFAMRGSRLPDYVEGDKDIDIIAEFALEDREDRKALEDFRIWTDSGETIPLTAVADLTPTKGFGTIHRKDRRTSLSITVNLEGEDLEKSFEHIDAALATLHMPRGYSWSRGDRYMEMMEDQQQQLFAFAMAIVLVFLLMSMLFESLSLPLSIITAVPFAMFGAYWMLLITGTPFDLMAGIGIVIMVGIVVNNAIVLVDLVQLNRHSGMTRREALLHAGQQRFRPILMTAATTIVGLIPMAVGNASLAGIPYKALGRVVIGGLITSSLMTLLLVPLLYTFIDDMRGWFGKIAGFALAREEKS